MKKWFSIISIIIVSTTLHAQAISVDHLIPNGLRQISATGIKVDISGCKYTFALNAAVGERGELWGLVVGSDYHMDENTELLMRLDNDEIIHLSADRVNASTRTTPEHYTTYTFGGISETYVEPEEERAYFVSIFTLTDNQVSLLEDHSIKKMRISLGQSYLEKASGLKKMSRWLSKSAMMIRDRIQRPMKSPTSITDGF